jgi:hypothetical protein
MPQYNVSIKNIGDYMKKMLKRLMFIVCTVCVGLVALFVLSYAYLDLSVPGTTVSGQFTEQNGYSSTCPPAPCAKCGLGTGETHFMYEYIIGNVYSATASSSLFFDCYGQTPCTQRGPYPTTCISLGGSSGSGSGSGSGGGGGTSSS